MVIMQLWPLPLYVAIYYIKNGIKLIRFRIKRDQRKLNKISSVHGRLAMQSLIPLA